MRAKPLRGIKLRTPWRICIRLRGDLRSDVRNYMNDIQRGFDRKRRFPQITLFGPFSTRMNRQQLINAIITESEKYPNAKFSTDGFSSFEQSGWFKQGRGIIFVKVNPNESLKQLRCDTVQLLLPYSQTLKSDQDELNDFKFHITLAIGRTGDTFKTIKKHLKSFELKHEDITPELVLYYNKAPVFTYLIGHGNTVIRPQNLYVDPK
ncbi:MAG: 2'-5' RNA ligase family protein [Thaumarchaeota archaeon]|nr:2'-5' RNA ligase family protein [Nitrososphaerota archaeon]